MKTDMILKSTVLDILFENRNKQYGAYVLRKFYPLRLKKAILITLMFSLTLFLLLSSFKKVAPVKIPVKPSQGILVKPVEQKKEEVKPKPKTDQPKGNSTKAISPLTPPKFVTEEEIPVMPKTPTDGSINGNTKDTGSALPGFVGNPDGKDTLVKTIPEIIPTVEKEDLTKIFEYPDVEPSYPGGYAALAEYLQSKLGDEAIEDGSIKKITVNFIVETDGTISNIKTVNNTDMDFIKKTERTFLRMKKWNSGKVKGHPVRTYYSLPVTILPGED